MQYVDYKSDATYQDVDAAFASSIKTLLANGATVTDTVHNKQWLELMGCTVAINNPQARILNHPRQPLDIIGAVARFLWMARGAQDLESIEFYVPPVARFAVSGVIPGSCYGHRLRQAEGGTVDQLKGIIERLKNDPRCRQASGVIWLPIDAVREQIDIPCAMSVSYHWREEGLYATTVMRSNKPSTLLPFNVFEFTLFGEIVAAELGTEHVGYTHIVNVAQLPYKDLERARSLAAYPVPDSIAMPHMPSTESPLEQIALLSELEKQIRHADNYEKAMQAIEADTSLNNYWRAYAYVLALRLITRDGDIEKLEQVINQEHIPHYFTQPLRQYIALKKEVQ